MIPMTSNTVPIYRHGRKFYVSTEEYERIRSEERRQRRTATLKSQNLPVPKFQQAPARPAATSLYIPIQRTQSNPSDYRYGVLRTPYVPANALINAACRRTPTRLSRLTFRNYDEPSDLSSITSSISKKSISSTIRSTSSDKLLDIRRTPVSSDSESDIKRSFSAEMTKFLSSSPPPKPKQRTPISFRRPVPTIISDYGISPTTSLSLTPNEQSHTQTNSSKLINYIARMQQSSLNPPSKSSPSAFSGAGSIFESGVQGSDHTYTVFGSPNRRTGGTTSSSLLARSTSDNVRNDYYHHNTASGTSLSDDNSSSLFTFIPGQNTDYTRLHRSEYINQLEDDSNQQRDLWTRSTIRSQSSDGLTEKKRVRFADTEGLTLETIPNRNQFSSSVNNRLFTRQPHVKVSSDVREQSRPFHHTLYEVTTKIGGNKLATDV